MAIRIAHFTDLHFTADPGTIAPRDLLSKRLLGWANLRFGGRYKDFAETCSVTEAFLRDLETIEADALVFTGDVTGLALDSEFLAAKKCLRPILEDERVIGIPGNHDVYVRKAERERLFERHFPSWVKSDWQQGDIPSSCRGSYPYPIVRLVGDDAAVVAIKDSRSAAPHDSSGRVPQDQLSALERIVRSGRLDGRALILAMHYCLCLPDGRRDKRLHRLRNDRELLALAEKLGIRVILCGHVHHRMVYRVGRTFPVTLVNPGSLTYAGRSRAYHLIDIDGDEIQLSARRYDAAIESFSDWPEAPGAGLLTG